MYFWVDSEYTWYDYSVTHFWFYDPAASPYDTCLLAGPRVHSITSSHRYTLLFTSSYFQWFGLTHSEVIVNGSLLFYLFGARSMREAVQ